MQSIQYMSLSNPQSTKNQRIKPMNNKIIMRLNIIVAILSVCLYTFEAKSRSASSMAAPLNYAWMRIVKRSEDRAQPQLSEIIGEPSTSSNGVGGLIVTSEGSSYGIVNHGPTTECLEWIKNRITNGWNCEMFAIN